MERAGEVNRHIPRGSSKCTQDHERLAIRKRQDRLLDNAGHLSFIAVPW